MSSLVNKDNSSFLASILLPSVLKPVKSVELAWVRLGDIADKNKTATRERTIDLKRMFLVNFVKTTPPYFGVLRLYYCFFQNTMELFEKRD